MERVHRIFSNTNPDLKSFLDREAIRHEYDESVVGLKIFLLIPESDPKWPQVAEFISAHSVIHSVELKFTTHEIRDAGWCELGVASHSGYPQPEDDFGYRRVTYNPMLGCRECGSGHVQVAPFRFRKIPAQRRSPLLQLNWVFDEFFVSADARRQLEASGLSGFGFETVVLHKTGDPIPGWSQLKIESELSGSVDARNLVAERCLACGVTKYNHPEGELLRLSTRPPPQSPDIVKTAERFGSGGAAHRIVLVSQRFVACIVGSTWRGVHLQPVAT